MTFNGFFQNAYVTRDIDRALAVCAPAMGLVDVAAHDFDLVLRTPEGERTASLRVATGWVGGLQVELIQPVAGHVAPYVAGLPADPDDFVPRWHHLALRRDDPDALAREVAALGLPLIFETGGNGIASTFLDATSLFGHPVEFVCATPDGWAMLGWPQS